LHGPALAMAWPSILHGPALAMAWPSILHGPALAMAWPSILHGPALSMAWPSILHPRAVCSLAMVAMHRAGQTGEPQARHLLLSGPNTRPSHGHETNGDDGAQICCSRSAVAADAVAGLLPSCTAAHHMTQGKRCSSSSGRQLPPASMPMPAAVSKHHTAAARTARPAAAARPALPPQKRAGRVRAPPTAAVARARPDEGC
jgi:hypothetical protein